MDFTPEQKSFIEDRGHNILVSAAAGSGKTAVIVERVINEAHDSIGITMEGQPRR